MAESARVVVGVSGSLSSLGALHRAVELARERNAVLVPVLAWHPVGGEYAYRSAPCPQLLKVWEEAARKRLDTAFEQRFGGYPAGVRVQPMLVRDENPGAPWWRSPTSPATPWWSAPDGRGGCTGCCAPRSGATAWRTPTAWWWRYRRPSC